MSLRRRGESGWEAACGGGGQGKARCQGAGDARLSHGAPSATRWHLNLCVGQGSDTGVPGVRSAPGALKMLLAAVPTGDSAMGAGWGENVEGRWLLRQVLPSCPWAVLALLRHLPCREAHATALCRGDLLRYRTAPTGRYLTKI